MHGFGNTIASLGTAVIHPEIYGVRKVFKPVSFNLQPVIALEMSAVGSFRKIHYMTNAGYQRCFGVAADNIDLFQFNIVR